MNLQSNRLRLRPWQEADLEALTNMNAESEVNRWLGGPSLVDSSQEALRLYRERYATSRWGVLCVEDLAGQFLGLAGLQPVRPTIPVAPAVEAVWRFRHAAWGFGYACEAMTLILDALPEDSGLDEVVAIVTKPNLRSAKTAERLAFRYDPSSDFIYPSTTLDHALRPHRVFRRPLK